MAETGNQFTCIVFLEMFLYTNVNKGIEKQESELLTNICLKYFFTRKYLLNLLNIGEKCMQTMPSYLYF